MNTKGKIEKRNINMFLTLMDFIIMIIKHNLIIKIIKHKFKKISFSNKRHIGQAKRP